MATHGLVELGHELRSAQRAKAGGVKTCPSTAGVGLELVSKVRDLITVPLKVRIIRKQSFHRR